MSTPSLSWRGKAGLLLGIVSLFGLFPVAAYTIHPLGGGAVLVVYLVLFVGIGTIIRFTTDPYRGKVGSDSRRASEPAQTEYAQLCAEHGVPVRGVWTVDELEWSYGLGEIWGLVPGNRHLFLETMFFDVYSGDERTAAVLQQIALADSYYRFLATLLGGHVVIGYYVSIRTIMALTESSNPFPDWPGVPELLLVVLFVISVAYARRKVYRADRFAAERTDEATVVSVLEKLDEIKREDDRERWEIPVLSLLWTRPSPTKRIHRLQGRNDRLQE